MPTTLIFGPGYLGTRMSEAIPNAILTTARIDDADEIREAFEEFHPDRVLNCAGKTGKPNIDWCETNQLATFRSNTIGPLVLAEVCREFGLHLTHLASGCIFYDASPDPAGWREDDFANPKAVYTRSKYAADLVLSKLPDVAIIRIRMPIDRVPNSRNLINKLANYPKVIDVENSVTIVDDLIEAVTGVMDKKGTGIFHAVNSGTMRHRQLIDLYNELVDSAHTNEWITTEELEKQGLAVATRSNCILQNNRLPELGIQMRPLDAALRDTMEKYAVAFRASKSAT